MHPCPHGLDAQPQDGEGINKGNIKRGKSKPDSALLSLHARQRHILISIAPLNLSVDFNGES